MADKILLNQQPYTIKEIDLPCLVTYEAHMGGSHMSVTLVANLFEAGSKLLLFTAYPSAKENFLEQVGTDHSKIAFVSSIAELPIALGAQAIILESGNEALFLEVVESLSDLRERVVLVKNIEKFSEAVSEIYLSLEKVIISGHLDTCVAKEKIAKKSFKTIIAFNQPATPLPITVPALEKWNGYLSSKDKNGLVVTQK